MGWVPFRQYEVLEWDGAHGLGAQPPVGHCLIQTCVCICVCGSALYKPVWGGCLSGSMRCWNEMAHMDWDPSHLSDMALYKLVCVCGGGGCLIQTCVGWVPYTNLCGEDASRAVSDAGMRWHTWTGSPATCWTLPYTNWCVCGGGGCLIQTCVGRMPLWQYEVLEWYGTHGLGAQPPVGHGLIQTGVCVCVWGGALYKPVWGGCLSGSMRCWNEMAHMDWEPSDLSDMALYKLVCVCVCGGVPYTNLCGEGASLAVWGAGMRWRTWTGSPATCQTWPCTNLCVYVCVGVLKIYTNLCGVGAFQAVWGAGMIWHTWIGSPATCRTWPWCSTGTAVAQIWELWRPTVEARHCVPEIIQANFNELHVLPPTLKKNLILIKVKVTAWYHWKALVTRNMFAKSE